jgi:hypothetical protein
MFRYIQCDLKSSNTRGRVTSYSTYIQFEEDVHGSDVLKAMYSSIEIAP